MTMIGMGPSIVVGWISVILLAQFSAAFICPLNNGSFSQAKNQQQHCWQSVRSSSLRSSVDDQANEAIDSLRNFHVGQWTGRAISFTVTNDVAAGVVRRNISRNYTSTMEVSTRGFQETITFDDVLRSVNVDFDSSQIDVDAVDASYSLDQAEDVVKLLPPESLDAVEDIGFCVEHCLVTGDNQRVRCFVIYDTDDQLARIIVANEDRDSRSVISNKSESKRQWQSAMISSTTDEGKALEPTTANLVEVTSGVWLGDAIIRDNLSVLMSPLEKKGFGETKLSSIPFASWSVGVQKIAWRWLWDFEEEIRQVVDLGKSLGTEMLGTDQFNVIGAVISNESLSRRIAKEERIVFIDWERDAVSFMVGSVSIQAGSSFLTTQLSTDSFFTYYWFTSRYCADRMGFTTAVPRMIMLRVFSLAILMAGTLSFVPTPLLIGRGDEKNRLLVCSSREDSPSIVEEITVTLKKPLGLILEEVQEGAAAVKEISEGGSAFPLADKINGKIVAKVMDVDCTALDFDSVMDLIVNTESDEVILSFAAIENVAAEEATKKSSYKVGDTVTIKVRQAGKEDLVFDAKVGDNLRQALIENKFEVYQGMKQKLGNCGGAGQCGFCAMTFIESDGWYDRSDYEDKKLAKFPSARLSCLNNIQGPVTMEKVQR